jgi:hypothetical protein
MAQLDNCRIISPGNTSHIITNTQIFQIYPDYNYTEPIESLDQKSEIFPKYKFDQVCLVSNDNTSHIVKTRDAKISSYLSILIDADTDNYVDYFQIITMMLDSTYLSKDVCSVVCSFFKSKHQPKIIHLEPKYAISEAINFITKYMAHQKGIKGKMPLSPIVSKRMSKNIDDQWVAKLLDDLTPDLNEDEFGVLEYNRYSDEEKKMIPQKRKILYNIADLCNYLGIECLLQISCAKIASMIKGIDYTRVEQILNGTY